MLLLDDIWDEGKKIVGACDDAKFLRWVGDAFELIANKLDPEALRATLDICTAGCSCSGTSNCRTTCGRRCVTLPREIDSILAVNVCGHPAVGFGELFSFHMNGPGDLGARCDYSWYDMGRHFCTYRDLVTPAHLVAYLERPEDNGTPFFVYGFDSKGNVLRREVGGQWFDGIQIPTVYGYAVPDAGQPLVARITAILKDRTAGSIRLATVDSSGGTGVNLGVYEPDERTPQFRRIQLNRSCDWVRIAYRKATFSFHSRFDHIPLRSRRALLLSLQAVKQYSALQLAEAHAFEADAARIETESQIVCESPTVNPIQVFDRTQSLRDKSDYNIV